MSDKYAQIDDYLAGNLEGDARRQFEQAMDADPGLAREVALYRDMANALKPDGEDALRANLEQLGQKYAPPEPPSNARRLGWAVAVVLLLLCGGLAWKWCAAGPAQPHAPAPPALEKNAAPAAPLTPTEPVAGQQNPSPSPKATTPKAPLLAANFEPNPRLETLLGSQYRGGAFRVRVDAPPANGQLTRTGGQAVFRLSGAAEPERANETPALQLLLYGNRSADYEQSRPVWRQNLAFEKSGDAFRFRLEKRLDLAPGIYYYLIEDPDTGMLLYAGKVTLAR